MVLKSPKGIYMQLETGKIIAIRTSFKMGQGKEKSPSGLIGREFNEKRPNLMRSLGPIPSSEKMPSNLKNNSTVSVTPNKPGRPPGGSSPYGRGGHPVPYATHGASHGTTTSPTRPVSLLQKPRPNTAMIKNRMPQNINNKNIQLGTARPYNLKQGPRLPLKNIRSSQLPIPTSSNSNSSFEGESSNETKYFERRIDDMKHDVEIKKPIDPSNKVEVISQEVIRKADVERDEATSGNSNDDVIMISADDKPVMPKLPNDPNDPNPYYNYGNNVPYYNSQGYQQRSPYPHYNHQQQQHPQQHPYYNQYAPAQNLNQQHHSNHQQQHSLHPPSQQNYDYSSPISTLSSTAPSPSVSHSYSSPSPSTIQSPTSATSAAMITIDDDQPLREKVVYKPNLVERKGKQSSKKNTDKFSESYQQSMNAHPHYPQQQPQYHPPMPSPTNNSLKNYRHKTSKHSPNSEDFHFGEHGNVQDSETSLSFLERTASSINENQSAFNASLSDITKPPQMMSPTVVPPAKSKAKPRAKAPAAPKKAPKTPKPPAEPKVPKEKAKSTTKKSKQNVPVTPAPLPSTASHEHNSNSSSSSYAGSEQTSSIQQQHQQSNSHSQLPLPPASQQPQNQPQPPIHQQQPPNPHGGYGNYPPQPQSYGNYPPTTQQQHPALHSQAPNDQPPGRYAPQPYPQYNMGKYIVRKCLHVVCWMGCIVNPNTQDILLSRLLIIVQKIKFIGNNFSLFTLALYEH